MDTGTTIEKPEVIEACYQHLREASAKYQKANAAVSQKLTEAGITPDEFVAYCRGKEPKTVKQ